MSQADIDLLMELWALSMEQYEGEAPFADHDELFAAIDNICVRDAPWKCFETVIPDNLPRDSPEWLSQSYQVWFQDPDTVIWNILSNPDFAKEFDMTPFIDLDTKGKQHWNDFMSGNYSWQHVVRLLLF